MKLLNEDDVGLPVYGCARDEWDESMTPIGYAESKGKAARMIRRSLSERDGDPYEELTANTIYFSGVLKAYFAEE